MADKPTYEELEQRVRELEEETNRSKHAEKELMDSEERFRCLTESSPLGVFQTDKDGSVLYLNNKWLAITGMSLQDALEFGWSQALHPEDRPRILAEWARCLEEKIGSDVEFRFVRPSGEIRWVRTRTSPVFSPAGDIISHVGVNEDITERKQAEDALRESEEKYRHLFEMESDAIFLIRNSDGQILEVNTAGVKL
ncbi:MAG: PAS domain S-box protein, partial [Desulfobacterales bacterium]